MVQEGVNQAALVTIEFLRRQEIHLDALPNPSDV